MCTATRITRCAGNSFRSEITSTQIGWIGGGLWFFDTRLRLAWHDQRWARRVAEYLQRDAAKQQAADARTRVRGHGNRLHGTLRRFDQHPRG